MEQNTEHLLDHPGCVKHTSIPNFYRATPRQRGIYCVMALCSSVRVVRGRGTARCQVVQRHQRRDVVVHAAYCYWGYGRTTGWPTYRLCLAFLVL